MPTYVANLSMLWPELDVYDRFRAAAEAGFSRVEILFVHTLDLARVEQQLRDLHLSLLLFDPSPGDWEAGERGLACNPDRRPEFQRTLDEALQTAQRLGVPRLNVLTGIPTPDVGPDLAHETLVANFQWVAPRAAAAGVTLLIENINPTDFPGYHVRTVERAANLVRAVGAPNVRVQFDQYHVGMVGGDARALIREYLALVEHVQIADVPGRHEPGTGQQLIAEFLSDLDSLGYRGAVGLEYRPSGPTQEAIAWLPRADRG
ncbi:MAG TPA: TIM barrel protein [Chloroflexota bacterium]